MPLGSTPWSCLRGKILHLSHKWTRRKSWTAPTLSGLQTTWRSSKHANNLSPSREPTTAHNAECWPKQEFQRVSLLTSFALRDGMDLECSKTETTMASSTSSVNTPPLHIQPWFSERIWCGELATSTWTKNCCAMVLETILLNDAPDTTIWLLKNSELGGLENSRRDPTSCQQCCHSQNWTINVAVKKHSDMIGCHS